MAKDCGPWKGWAVTKQVTAEGGRTTPGELTLGSFSSFQIIKKIYVIYFDGRRKGVGREGRREKENSRKSPCPSSAWSQGPTPSTLTCYGVFRLLMQIQVNMNMGGGDNIKPSPLKCGAGCFGKFYFAMWAGGGEGVGVTTASA